jgi:hypothetical protein
LDTTERIGQTVSWAGFRFPSPFPFCYHQASIEAKHSDGKDIIMNAKRCLGLALTSLVAAILASAGGAGEKKATKGNTRTFDLPKEGRAYFFVRLPAKQIAEFSVKSEKDPDVDLFIYDGHNKLVGEDTDTSPHCKVIIEPEKDGLYRMGVVNFGDGPNRCSLTFPGEEIKPKLSAIDAFDIKAREKIVFYLAFQGGQPAIIRIESEKDTDVDLLVYVKDKKDPVAVDQRLIKDCLVAFIPAETTTYRIEVVNEDMEKDNRCKVEHSGKEAKGQDKKE